MQGVSVNPESDLCLAWRPVTVALFEAATFSQLGGWDTTSGSEPGSWR